MAKAVKKLQDKKANLDELEDEQVEDMGTDISAFQKFRLRVRFPNAFVWSNFVMLFCYFVSFIAKTVY